MYWDDYWSNFYSYVQIEVFNFPEEILFSLSDIEKKCMGTWR